MRIQIQVEISRPGWLRLPRTWRTRTLTVALAAVVVGVPIAWASHQFADVPNSNPHHTDISIIRTAGITQGCNPPANNLYCPDHPVRRDQMASFLQRGLGRGARGHAAATLTGTEANVATATLTVPGSGFVLVNATLDVNTAAAGCPCRFWFRVVDPVTGHQSWYTETVVASSSAGSAAATFLFPVTVSSPTARTFEARARLAIGTGSHTGYSDITALWVPFGSAGGNTLGGAADTPQPQGGSGPNAQG